MKLTKNSKFQINVPYALTLTPCDKYQFAEKENRFNRFRNFMYENFISKKFKYEMFIEISEPIDQKQLSKGSLGPRLHLHGTIEFKSKAQIGKFLLSGIHQFLKYGNVYIHTIDDLPTWQEYCNKQKLFKKNRISNYT